MKTLFMFMGEALVLVSAAMILFVAPGGAWSEDTIAVRHLVEGKKVIPVTCRIGNWEITDIKLPDLVVTNARKAPLRVAGVDVIGKVSGSEATRLHISGESLSEAIATLVHALNTAKPPLPTLQLAYGNVILPEGELSEKGTAGKGQSILLPLSRIAYLHHVGHATLDGMEILLTLKSGSKKTVVSFPVALTRYEAKGKYVFPLKGDMRMAFLPLSYIHHRSSASQEFAMDVVGANQKDGASFTEISRPSPRALSDYSIWGREVLAIGDGVVAETGDKFPEEPMSDPARFEKPGYASTVVKEMIPKIGWTNAIAGNYVIIDHRNGEFSVYCHLQEGSIRVKPGDTVKKAEAIARVGNTGNSSAPHLHFQLMDNRNFLVANGLPIMFENVPSGAVIVEYPVTANSLSFSDSIFANVP